MSPVLVNPSRFVAPSGVTFDSLWAATGLQYAAWKLEETSGTSAADSVGTNTGTIASTGVTYSVAGPAGVGNGLTFDGNTGEVQCPFVVGDLGTAGGLGLVYKTSENNSTILVRTNSNVSGQGTFIGGSGTGVLVRVNGTNHTVSGLTAAALCDGNVHFVLLQTDGTTVEFWFDGTMIDSWANGSTWHSICGAPIDNGSPHHLFRSGTGSGTSAFYAGTAYDYRLYNGGTLTGTQIAALSTAALT